MSNVIALLGFSTRVTVILAVAGLIFALAAALLVAGFVARKQLRDLTTDRNEDGGPLTTGDDLANIHHPMGNEEDGQ